MTLVKPKAFKNICSNCRVVLRSISSPMGFYERISCKVLGKQRYCSDKCLKEHTASMSYDGAIHHVHQKFGPNHPVTLQIQQMRREIKGFRKLLDIEGKRKRGEIHEDKNFQRLCHMTEKCL